jgi:hypothetical protein
MQQHNSLTHRGRVRSSDIEDEVKKKGQKGKNNKV